MGIQTMVEERVETGVDSLIVYLKEHGKSSLKDAAASLKLPEETLQLWVDFLVEERILGVEYKFTKPFIFLNKEDKAKAAISSSHEEDVTLETFKVEFFQQAKKKQLPEQQIPSLWQAHLDEALDKQKDFFIREAKKRYLDQPEDLFVSYKRKLARM